MVASASWAREAGAPGAPAFFNRIWYMGPSVLQVVYNGVHGFRRIRSQGPILVDDKVYREPGGSVA